MCMETPDIQFIESADGRLTLQFGGGTSADRVNVDSAWLRAFAAERGFGTLLFDAHAMDLAISLIRKGEATQLQIASRTDSTYAVEVGADKMTAWLTVECGCGGTPPSAQAAVAALSAVGVREGVDATAVECAITQ